MPGPFDITATTSTVRLDESRRGTVAFTVTNASEGLIRGRARLVTEDPAAGEWFQLVGAWERDFAPVRTEQVTAEINVPADAPAGSYPFRLEMVGVDDPDELFSEGPAVVLEVPGPEGKAPRRFPWWILAVVAGVLVVLAIVLALIFWPRKVEVPDLVDWSYEDARDELEGLDLVVKRTESPSSAFDAGNVIETEPEAGVEVARDSTVLVTVSSGPGFQQDVLALDPEMTLDRLFGDCAQGVFGREYVDLYGLRVGLSGAEDCPPPSEWTVLLNFDIEELAGATIEEARLDLSGYEILGDPFATYGGLQVKEVSYPGLVPGSVLMIADMGELDRLMALPGEVDVSDALDGAIQRGSKRFQIQLQFEDVVYHFDNLSEALAAPTYYLLWDRDAIKMDVTFSR